MKTKLIHSLQRSFKAATNNVWEFLWRCFPRVRRAGMTPSETNYPFNGITLKDFVHTQFGKFELAVVATVCSVFPFFYHEFLRC